MARLARVEYEGAIYHVTIRGNNRRDLFGDDRDRLRFLERLEDEAQECAVRIYAFCLMRNHVHLVGETLRANLGRFMHKLETAYTIYYNKRHRESGHLMQGRYGAKLVEGDEYLLALTRYVHLNPVYIGAMTNKPLEERARALRTYPWSSYRSYLGMKAWGFVQTGPLLAMMSSQRQGRRRVEFQRFMEAALAENDEEFLAIYRGSRLGIGGENFLAKLESLYGESAGKRNNVEDVVLRRTGRRLDSDRILAVVCRHLGVKPGEERCRRRGSWTRAVGARMLSRFGGLTQREIAGRLGVGTGKSVSDQLHRLSEALATDKTLDRLVNAVEKEVAAEGRPSKH
jgi:REP element-mobilizing transposase RayT